MRNWCFSTLAWPSDPRPPPAPPPILPTFVPRPLQQGPARRKRPPPWPAWLVRLVPSERASFRSHTMALPTTAARSSPPMAVLAGARLLRRTQATGAGVIALRTARPVRHFWHHEILAHACPRLPTSPPTPPPPPPPSPPPPPPPPRSYCAGLCARWGCPLVDSGRRRHRRYHRRF